MKYRMYVDEVGNSDLDSSDNPLHRFLSLTGIIIDLDYVRSTVHPKLEEIKDTFFEHHPDDPIILHRKEILNAKYPFRSLKDNSIRADFDATILKFLQESEYTVITACLDKKRHKETYTSWRYDPYHYCLALLIERFVFFLEQHESEGDVLAESRGGREDKRLKKSYEGLWENGTEYIESEKIQNVLTSKRLKVKLKKNNISGLQIADLIAHPSRNEILIENNINQKLSPFAKKIIKILEKKYYQKNGKTVGFGKKFL